MPTRTGSQPPRSVARGRMGALRSRRPERATLHARTTLAASRASFRGASRTARCDGAELMRERDLLRAPAGERGHAGLLRALHVPHLVDATAPGQVHPGREADDGAV